MREDRKLLSLVSGYKKTGIIIVLLCVTLLTLIIYSRIPWPGVPSPEADAKLLLKPGSDATHVFTGTVLSIESKWVVNEKGVRVIYSWAEIEVDEYMKGEGSQIVTVKYQGGCIGGIGIIVEVMPGGTLWLEVGEKITVYARLVDPDESLFTTWYVEHQPERTHEDSIITPIEIYRSVVHAIYDRSSFTRGRRVVIFIDPMARIPDQNGYVFPSMRPSKGKPLPPDLIEALEDLPAKRVSFAYAWEVTDPMSTGGRVREGGAFITLGVIEALNDNEAEVVASIHYGNLGASGWRCTLTKVDSEWRITKIVMTWIA